MGDFIGRVFRSSTRGASPKGRGIVDFVHLVIGLVRLEGSLSLDYFADCVIVWPAPLAQRSGQNCHRPYTRASGIFEGAGDETLRMRYCAAAIPPCIAIDSWMDFAFLVAHLVFRIA